MLVGLDVLVIACNAAAVRPLAESRPVSRFSSVSSPRVVILSRRQGRALAGPEAACCVGAYGWARPVRGMRDLSPREKETRSEVTPAI